MTELVNLQIGQCGNQVGVEIYNSLMNYFTPDDEMQFSLDEMSSTFFRENSKKGVRMARAVLVDMEPKVITAAIARGQKINSKSQGWCYDTTKTFYKQSGSGNNWAFGYNVHGPTSSEAVLNLVRKEVEMCDNFGAFFVTLSLAGGTGSGVGGILRNLF
jgi:tubulin delta